MKEMNTYDFSLDMQVRDYECDIQGIVNNAVYQNYLEHCRHKFLNMAGLDFSALHNEGVDAVVIRAELDYKYPLRPGDEFTIRLKIGKQGRLRMVFLQQIIRKNDMQVILNARIIAVLIRNNKPINPDILEEKFRNKGILIQEL